MAVSGGQTAGKGETKQAVGVAKGRRVLIVLSLAREMQINARKPLKMRLFSVSMDNQEKGFGIFFWLV